MRKALIMHPKGAPGHPEGAKGFQRTLPIYPNSQLTNPVTVRLILDLRQNYGDCSEESKTHGDEKLDCRSDGKWRGWANFSRDREEGNPLAYRK